MNLIVCDEGCKHQQEGYCTLDSITRLTGDLAAKCGYYEAREKKTKQRPQSILPDDGQRL